MAANNATAKNKATAAKSTRTGTTSTKKTTSAPTQKEPTKFVPKDIDIHQYVTVQNGFQGRLIYISPKTGEQFIWPEFGDEQEMELGELKSARNSSKKFFENNWFMFPDDWVVDYLGVRQFYKHAIRVEDFDNIFQLSPDELVEEVKSMNKGQKSSVAYRARQLIAEEKIDSNKLITALESALGTELVER